MWNQFKSIKIPHTPFTIKGYSKAADKTCFYLPDLNIMLDCGIECSYLPDYIFITHGHADHSSNMPLNIVQLANFRNIPHTIPTFYLPNEIVNNAFNFIQSFYTFSKNNPNHAMESRYQLKGLTSLDKFNLNIKGNQWIIETFKCHHAVPCIGYGFNQLKSKLKPEYQLIDKQELVKLKYQGVTITQIVESPLFCYLGDSTIEVFTNTAIFNYPVIMTECTFYKNEDIDKAVNKQHIHWNDLQKIVIDHPTNYFILYHFSKKYDDNDIKRFFGDLNLNNVIIWI